MRKTKYVGKHSNGAIIKHAKMAFPVLPRIQLANLPCGCLDNTKTGKRNCQHVEQGEKKKRKIIR